LIPRKHYCISLIGILVKNRKFHVIIFNKKIGKRSFLSIKKIEMNVPVSFSLLLTYIDREDEGNCTQRKRQYLHHYLYVILFFLELLLQRVPVRALLI